jgi:hypothetical protein
MCELKVISYEHWASRRTVTLNESVGISQVCEGWHICDQSSHALFETCSMKIL